MDWRECHQKRLAKPVAVDHHLVTALRNQSEKRLLSYEMMPLTEVSASSKVSLLYDSVRELLEALAITRGFKIYNHECYCPFLKEVIHDSSLGDVFDRLRKIRNGIHYYGEDIRMQEAQEILQKLHFLRKKIQALLPS